MRKLITLKYRQPLRCFVILLFAGIYGVTFLAQTVAAVTSENGCGIVCCCKQMPAHVSLSSFQSPHSGCCSGKTLPACNLQDGVAFDFPDSAVPVTQLPGKRLLSDSVAFKLIQSEQLLLSKVSLQSETISNRQYVPLYLQTLSLLY